MLKSYDMIISEYFLWHKLQTGIISFQDLYFGCWNKDVKRPVCRDPAERFDLYTKYQVKVVCT